MSDRHNMNILGVPPVGPQNEVVSACAAASVPVSGIAGASQTSTEEEQLREKIHSMEAGMEMMRLELEKLKGVANGARPKTSTGAPQIPSLQLGQTVLTSSASVNRDRDLAINANSEQSHQVEYGTVEPNIMLGGGAYAQQSVSQSGHVQYPMDYFSKERGYPSTSGNLLMSGQQMAAHPLGSVPSSSVAPNIGGGFTDYSKLGCYNTTVHPQGSVQLPVGNFCSTQAVEKQNTCNQNQAIINQFPNSGVHQQQTHMHNPPQTTESGRNITIIDGQVPVRHSNTPQFQTQQTVSPIPYQLDTTFQEVGRSFQFKLEKPWLVFDGSGGPEEFEKFLRAFELFIESRGLEMKALKLVETWLSKTPLSIFQQFLRDFPQGTFPEFKVLLEKHFGKPIDSRRAMHKLHLVQWDPSQSLVDLATKIRDLHFLAHPQVPVEDREYYAGDTFIRCLPEKWQIKLREKGVVVCSTIWKQHRSCRTLNVIVQN